MDGRREAVMPPTRLKNRGLSSSAKTGLPALSCLFHRGEEEDSPAKMVQRLTYRRRHSYATKSNKQRVLRTPGACGGAWGAAGMQGRARPFRGPVMQAGMPAPSCPHPGSYRHHRFPFVPAGGKLTLQTVKKKTTHPTCPISGQRLHGVSTLRCQTMHRRPRQQWTARGDGAQALGARGAFPPASPAARSAAWLC